MMNEKSVWAWLWTNTKPLYYIAGWTRVIDLLVWLNVLSPTDEISLSQSQRRSDRIMRAIHVGIAARKAGKERTPPHIVGTDEYQAWLNGWDHGLEWSIKYSVNKGLVRSASK